MKHIASILTGPAFPARHGGRGFPDERARVKPVSALARLAMIAACLVVFLSLSAVTGASFADEITQQAHQNVLKKLDPATAQKVAKAVKKAEAKIKARKAKGDEAIGIRRDALQKVHDKTAEKLDLLEKNKLIDKAKSKAILDTVSSFSWDYSFGAPHQSYTPQAVKDEIKRLRKAEADKKKEAEKNKTASSGGVRYDSPTIAGFTPSASWGEDDYWDTALRYANNVAYGGTGCRAGSDVSVGRTSKSMDATVGRREFAGVVLDDALIKVEYKFPTRSVGFSGGCNVFGGELAGNFMWQPKSTLNKGIEFVSLFGDELGLAGPIAGTGFLVNAGFGDIRDFYYRSEMQSVGGSVSWSKPFVAGNGPFGPIVVVPGAWGYLGHSSTDTMIYGRTNGFTSDFGYDNKVDDTRYGFGASLGADGVLEDTDTVFGRLQLSHYNYFKAGVMIHDVDARSTLSFTGQNPISNSVSDTKTSFVADAATGLRATIADRFGVQAGVAVAYESNYPMMKIDGQRGLFIDSSETFSVRGQFAAWFFF